MTELKPCPFCGGTLLVIGQTTYNDFYYVKCTECRAHGCEKREEAEALKAWNERVEI